MAQVKDLLDKVIAVARNPQKPFLDKCHPGIKGRQTRGKFSAQQLYQRHSGVPRCLL